MSDNDKFVKAYCDRHSFEFKPWEPLPWEVNQGPSPWPDGSAGATTWPRMQALRQKILVKNTNRNSGL